MGHGCFIVTGDLGELAGCFLVKIDMFIRVLWRFSVCVLVVLVWFGVRFATCCSTVAGVWCQK